MRPQALARVGESSVTGAGANRMIMQASGLFLMLAGADGFTTDILGAFFEGDTAPHATLGFVEAHGLAVIIGYWLLSVRPQRAWHLTGVAVHVLLGTCGLMSWRVFGAADALPASVVMTSLHWLFAAAQLSAAVRPSPTARLIVL